MNWNDYDDCIDIINPKHNVEAADIALGDEGA